MKRSALVVLALVFSLPVVTPAADPVQSIADDSYPRVAELAKGIVRASWAERLDALVTSAPTASVAGERWKPGDAHWEAAKVGVLSHVDAWCRDLVADPNAKGLVRQAFARGLDAAQASAMQRSLASPSTKEFPSMQDSIHLAVVFAGKHPELQIGSTEFSSAHAAWLASSGIVSSPSKETADLVALMKSDAGFAYGTARGNAIDSLATGLDGQVQLLFNDRQAALLEEIGRHAKDCAAAHH